MKRQKNISEKIDLIVENERKILENQNKILDEENNISNYKFDSDSDVSTIINKGKEINKEIKTLESTLEKRYLINKIALKI